MKPDRLAQRTEPHFGRQEVGEEPVRARRVDVPQGDPAASVRPEPVYVRAGEARAAKDTMDTVKSKLGWAAEWGKSIGKIGVTTLVIAGASAALGKFGGIDFLSPVGVLVNGALLAVAAKPFEWGGGALWSLAAKGVQSVKERLGGAKPKAADAAPVADVSPSRGPEVHDDAPRFDDAAVHEAQDARSAPIDATHDEIIAAIKFIATQEFLAQNPDKPLPTVPPEHFEEIKEHIFKQAQAGAPLALQSVEDIRAAVAYLREQGEAPAPAEPAPPEQRAEAQGPEGAPVRGRGYNVIQDDGPDPKAGQRPGASA